MLSLYVKIQGQLRRLTSEERGVTTVEYAIMLALVALAIALATPGIRDAVLAIFEETADALTTMQN